ncbi:hypothetical protein MAMC_01810 [Methylacidimicrobium cyclopophantes]|uniref:Uncharacterized protein n=1 Tax=Methylacidimicrobium cyclopophantes TaxID=1041766 RepID=A0A5E6MEV3_9BACT|nr:hypothetical protein MAMC_01810 [Methylacidimicrobium cyclopophantes]
MLFPSCSTSVLLRLAKWISPPYGRVCLPYLGCKICERETRRLQADTLTEGEYYDGVVAYPISRKKQAFSGQEE